eukprot:2322665-Pleurochrysis_carterae.AAC.2
MYSSLEGLVLRFCWCRRYRRHVGRPRRLSTPRASSRRLKQRGWCRCPGRTARQQATDSHICKQPKAALPRQARIALAAARSRHATGLCPKAEQEIRVSRIGQLCIVTRFPTRHSRSDGDL